MWRYLLIYTCKLSYMYILGDSIELKNQKDSFSKYINECERERDAFKEHRVNPRDLQSVFYVKPSFNNVRMKLQSGLFVIFGLKYQELNDQLIVDKNYFRETIMGIKPNGPIVIDKNSKDEILGELKFLC